MRHEPEKNGKPALRVSQSQQEETVAPQAAPTPAGESAAERPAAAPPAVPPVAPPVAVDPQPAEPPAAEPTPPAPAAAAEAGAGLRLSLNPAQPTIAVGATVAVTLGVNNAAQLFSMPMRVQYDRRFLELTSIDKGAFLEGDDASDIIFSRNIRQSNGLAAVNISRFPGTGGADGSGELITLTFKGLAAGQAKVRFMPTGPRNAESEVLKVAALAVDFTVE